MKSDNNRITLLAILDYGIYVKETVDFKDFLLLTNYGCDVKLAVSRGLIL